MATFTAEKLITDVRRRSMLPNATGLGSSDTDILAYLNDALQGYIAPLLLGVGGEYLVAYEDVTTSVGTAKYSIPSRSLGNKLRDVMFLCGDRYVSLQQAEPEQVAEYSTAGTPHAFYVEGSNVVLVPAPDIATTLRLKYYRRPNELVLSTACLPITDAVGGSSPIISVASGGAAFVGVPVDVISNWSAFNNKVTNAIPLVAEATEIIFSAGVISQEVLAGDWLCAADTSPVAQIPQELYPLLAQTAALEMADALNNPRSGEVLKKIEIMKNQVMPLLTPRSEGTGRVIINSNGVGYSRFKRFYGWFR